MSVPCLEHYNKKNLRELKDLNGGHQVTQKPPEADAANTVTITNQMFKKMRNKYIHERKIKKILIG